MAVPFIRTSFAHGEVTPHLWGHTDWAGFSSAASTLRNCYVDYRGGAYSRAGTAFVGQSKQRADLGDAPPRVIPFQFSITQGYVLEFGEQYIRFISEGGYVTEATTTISGATQANPCVITDTAHGYANGDWVVIAGVNGMTQLNGNTYVVAGATANTFQLNDPQGNAIDSTGFGAYTSGGTAARIYTITSPYAAVDLPAIKFIQSADVLSLVHPSYPPHDLKRGGATNWTLTSTTFGAVVAAPATSAATANVHPNSTATPPTLPAAYAYVATAIGSNGEESIASPIANVTDSVDLEVTAGSINISWGAVDGAASYNVYKSPTSYNTDTGSTTNAFAVPAGALMGFAGRSFGTQFVDSNVTPDFTKVPPVHKNPFAPGAITDIQINSSNSAWTNGSTTVAITSGTGSGFVGEVVVDGNPTGAITGVIILNPGVGYQAGDTATFTGTGTATSTVKIGPSSGTYPSVVTYFQERRVYADSTNSPDTFWMSKPALFTNFDSSIPVSDSDAITGTPFSQQVNGIQWMVSMPLGLLTFTANSVWSVGASGTYFASPTAITPSNVSATLQSSIGSDPLVPPLRINWEILYLQAKGYTVRNLTYQIYLNIYTAVDVSWQSAHLLVGHDLVMWTWCEEPWRIIWAVRDDGILLSFTYVKEQEVMAWARHDTQGLFKSACSITEPPVQALIPANTHPFTDALYLVAQRYLPGGDPGSNSRYYIERMNDRLWQSVEDTWAVDCAVATAETTSDITLYASATSGSGAGLFSLTPVFDSSNVNQIIRAGGGIFRVDAYVNSEEVTGTWLYPCQELIPGDPNGAALPITSWTIAPQVTTVGGLGHLAGKSVVGLADGIPVGPFTVTAEGTVTLPHAASRVVIGLGYTAQVQSLYLEAGQPTMQGRRKLIPRVTVRIQQSSPNFECGANQADSSALSPPPIFSSWTVKTAPSQPSITLPATYNTASGQAVQPAFTGDIIAPLKGTWDKRGQVAIQQTLPLPLAVLAIIPEVLPGDTPEAGLSQQQGPQGGGGGGGKPQRLAPQAAPVIPPEIAAFFPR